jgi:hypothetical protein
MVSTWPKAFTVNVCCGVPSGTVGNWMLCRFELDTTGRSFSRRATVLVAP